MSGSRMRRSVASIAVLVLAGLTGCSGSGDKIYGKNSLPPVNRSIGAAGSPLAGANNGGGLVSNAMCPSKQYAGTCMWGFFFFAALSLYMLMMLKVTQIR